jgi:4-amino-4-deoxy-L-arabinose transferase-like glycosyltransferase
MPNRTTNIIAALLLAIMFVMALGSMAGDSLTMDELAHLPAGYSYLTQKDMRLNPEHPPLMKDLAAIPLLFIKGINFPADAKSWKEDVNGQWEFGNTFLFKSQNPADKMIFWGRIPMILMLLLLGFYIFRWAKELFGNNVALLSLFLFSFSPTFLAHGRLVTTDVAAATGAFLATYYFVKFLKKSSLRNLFLAGIFLGIAELLKFSLILLLPFFGVIVFFWAIAKSRNMKEFIRIFFREVLIYILVVAIAYVLIVYPVYCYHTLNYPVEKQIKDTQFTLNSFGIKPLTTLTLWMISQPLFKPIAHYFLGLFMIFQRAAGGNTGYFLGEISAAGWKTYFPTVYAIKEPLSFFSLFIIALLSLAWQIQKPFWITPAKRALRWLRSHFAEFTMLLFIAIYWFTSIRSNLNIGVRHLLPTFPFTILLVSYCVINWLTKTPSKLKTIAVFLLLAWQVISIASVYPYFLAYFNGLAGGPDNGYKYVADSNLDWGQDLKRLFRGRRCPVLLQRKIRPMVGRKKF